MNSLKYKQYSSEEFADDKDFWLWVLEEDANQEAFWMQFIADNPDKAKEIEQARALVLQVNADKYKLEDKKVNTLWEKIQKSKEESDAKDNAELLKEHNRRQLFKELRKPATKYSTGS
ncbi:hypothetical protein DXT99_19215 [Pontibacter diazotrophicus]|uniref:Uncharacterized protein n=1 Tax=Pontibacter diazotrophicus TaxID=1400979 RepID=A0A3D8L865_9BACT|nr:hypothetical protein [Pontibacter diazotrophicus]RDV13486.1 hypothetical protein DXT99_19215 [Pontibacter diazotrophicus]